MQNKHNLTQDDLLALGYEIIPDPEQPTQFIWKKDTDSSEVNFINQQFAMQSAIADVCSQYTLHRCDNCGKVHTDETLRPAKHLGQRVEPGGIMPSGECDACAALCYPIYPATTSMRLVLDVEYALHGESAESIANNLEHLVHRAIGDGMLTGASSAEVEHHSFDVQVFPVEFEPLQTLVLEHYGDHAVATPGDVPKCGDGLLKFLLAEASAGEDCKSLSDLQERITKAQFALTRLSLNLFKTPHGA